MKYRSEIDGLRALSVLSVILFHAGFSTFGGGYVGVDVFFVISGYLITSIISREVESKVFSLKKFYERRARRILPVLLFVMFISCFFAWKWMLPQPLENFAKSILSVLFFGSNIFFWQQSGYFSTSNEEKPLIHTWSLSLEEQFYFLFPLILLGLWRLGKKRVAPVLGTLLLASLVLAHWGSINKPAASFFLLPTRMWELLMGSVLSVVSFQVTEKSEKWFALIGLGLIGVAVFSFNAQTLNPSFYTLIPTLGACFVIFAAKPTNFVGRFLAMPPLASIGLLSYSAYLWHQPVFALARIRSLTPLENTHYTALIVLVFVLAALSWKFIETPFRGDLTKIKIRALPGLLGCTVFLFLFSLVTMTGKGLPERFSQKALRLAATSIYVPPQCPDMSDEGSGTDACVIGDKDKKPSLAILGDSHASALLDVLGESLFEKGVSAVSVWAWGCAPFFDFNPHSAITNKKCEQVMNQGLQDILKDTAIKEVVLVGFWTRYLGSGDSAESQKSVFQNSLKRTLQELSSKNKKVIFVKTIPEHEVNVSETLAKKAIFGEPLDFLTKTPMDREAYFTENETLQEVLNSISSSEALEVVETVNIFCKQGPCRFMDDKSEAFYRDTNHLSRRGAQEVVPMILKRLQAASPS